jgi:2-polyprenyl-3-methyl-5-hydroxy-6-metoxy-1,4-benzoquinol methylase
MSLLSRFRERAEARLKRRTLARWLERPEVSGRVREVLELDPERIGLGAGAVDERGLPGKAEFRESGWTEHMLLRYCLVLEHARGKRVLDTCSGLGWGAHLIAGVAGEIVGIDRDQGAVDFCRTQWQDENLRFVAGSVLELPFEAESFDVVLCMGAIEHFTQDEGRRYLGELRRVCRPRGVLIGSSAFPETRAEADALCAKNPHHLYIYTRAEMRALLTQTFASPTRLTRHYFAARKPRRRT